MAGQQNAAPPAQAGTQGAPADGDGQQQGDALDELDAALGEDGGAGQDGGEQAQWTPPTREEWEAHQAALEAERAKLKRARQQAQRLREGAKPAAAAPAADGGEGAQAPSGPDPQITVWQTRAVRASAKAELLNRGADPDMVDLALARLHADQIEFDGEDEPILDTWLDEMEDRYPKLFAKDGAAAPAAGARPAAGVNQGQAAARQPPRALSFGEQVMANSARATQAGRRG